MNFIQILNLFKILNYSNMKKKEKTNKKELATGPAR
jgi:hypothetical protein